MPVEQPLSEPPATTTTTTRKRCCCFHPLWSSRPSVTALVVVLLGLAATTFFLGLGIYSAHTTARRDFDNSASLLAQQVTVAWNDYAVAALWVQQACTSYPDFSHQQFRELYERLLSTGMDAQIEFLPRVAHEQRELFENRTREYYNMHYPYIDYQGFVGVEPLPNGEYGLLPRSEQEFYYPIFMIEPIQGSETALSLDGYSRSVAQSSIDKALETFQATLSEPTALVEEKVPNALSVFLFSPGLKLSTQPNMKPRDLSVVIVRIPDLMERALQTLVEATSVFMFDTTGNGELFLGGAQLDPRSSPYGGRNSENLDNKPYTLFPSTTLSEVRKTSRLVKEHVVTTADREWTIAVVAVEGTYETALTFVVVGGVFLAICSICIAAWIYSSIRKDSMLKDIQNAAEKAALILETANQSAMAERSLNDFIAHEVRNPCAAAIAACSFVRAAVQKPDPLHDEKSRLSVREDMDIIDNSLNFINDLLRNMLDLHRASSKQLNLDTRLTDLYNDVLKPVDSMLYRRGSKTDVKVILECNPRFLFVNSDPLRLKQVMLNLGRNSAKFVERGFIRLTAGVVDGRVHLYVSDSGPGIPPEKRDRLFAKFQESLDSLSQGTGIGLHLCKNLIDLMNGRIWLDESYDSGVKNCPGARFVIDLNVPPASIDNAEASGESPPSIETVTSSDSSTTTADVSEQTDLPTGLNVMFCDDDTVVRKLVCRAVKMVAPTWTIREAANGETALQLVSEEGYMPDLIFMDMYMASVEKQLLGTEATRELRLLGVTSIICGFSANDMEAQFVEAGADAFLTKPFPCKKQTLELELRRILASRRKQPLPHDVV